MRGALLVAACVCVLASVGAAQGGVERLDRRPIDPIARSHHAPVVLVFTTIECPISNRYAPEIERLRREFSKRGFSFWLVFANPVDTAASINAHVKKFELGAAPIRDPEQTLVKRTGVTIAPEAAVIDRGTVVYRGRIDDRYVDFGVERSAPMRRDLHEALTELAAGRPISTPQTQAVGCVLADFVR